LVDDFVVSRAFTIILEGRAPSRVFVGLSKFGVPIEARPPSDIVRRQDALYWYALYEEGAG
jgi:hypothetical protein